MPDVAVHDPEKEGEGGGGEEGRVGLAVAGDAVGVDELWCAARGGVTRGGRTVCC